MSKRILLAAGGTGGHIFPAEALAEELMARGYDLSLMTDRRGAAYGGALGKIETLRIRAGAISGRGVLGKVKGVFDLVLGTFQAYKLIKSMRPAVVVGFGGYPSVPPMLGAIRAKVPTVVHEQNAVLGRANRLLAGGVTTVCTSFEHTTGIPEGQSVVHTGMPVRPVVLNVRDSEYPDIVPDGPIRILVIGGSQGARVLSEVVPAALKQLPKEQRERLHVTQQCRPEDLDAVKAAYDGSAITTDLKAFFDNVPDLLARSHLVIARAGASTMAELTCTGRPAILVPYPFATDDHQTANAHALDEVGGGWLMPQDTFTADALAARIGNLLGLPASLTRAAACAARAGRPDAAKRLADEVTKLAEPEREAA